MVERDDYKITSVVKALKVMKAFASDGPDFTLTQLSQKCGIGKTSMIRILASLQSEGFVRYNAETRKYHLGLVMYQLGTTAYGFMDIKKVCYPLLREAAIKSGQVIHLAVLAEDEIVVIDRIWAEAHIDIMGLIARVGGSVPVHCTGVGCVLAAYADKDQQDRLIAACDFKKYSETTVDDPELFRRRLAEVHQKGYAINDGEHEPFLRCLTRPIFGAGGKVVAAFSISGLKEVITDTKLSFYDQISQETAVALSREF
ncbi:MAG: IclR family transcriptional regulator [Sphaerochaetaceae bacterium]|nr:IclR family transcriptional regulator [Sphaerochaetaceae bacterium]